MSVACLFRDIIQNNPPLTHLDLYLFSSGNDRNDSAGEVILKALSNSSICSIQDLNLGYNSSWFNRGGADREGAIEMLTEIICNQT